jgi:hypothetical protein
MSCGFAIAAPSCVGELIELDLLGRTVALDYLFGKPFLYSLRTMVEGK